MTEGKNDTKNDNHWAMYHAGNGTCMERHDTLGGYMLNKQDLINATIVNIKNWDWSVAPTYKMDEETSLAVMEALREWKHGNDNTATTQDGRANM